MIDIHCHLIYDVDDGPSTIEESIKMVMQAEKLGIKTIIATPHFQERFFETERVIENFRQLKYKTSDYNVALKMGYEVFVNPYLSDVQGLTLNNSKYLLWELPFDSIPRYCFEILDKLQAKGVVPVVAHPERNRNFIKNFDLFMEFVERGCLIQLDAASLLGVYGMNVTNFTKKLIKCNLAHFVASDAHFPSDFENWHLKAYIKVCKWVGVEYADKLFNTNAKLILENSSDFIYKVI